MPGGGTSLQGSTKVNLTDGADSGVLVGYFDAPGAIAATDGHDSAAIAGTNVLGSISATEGRDTLVSGAASASGSIAATERHDSAVLVGLTPNAILTVEEGKDIPSFNPGFKSSGATAPTESPDLGVLLGGFEGGRIFAAEHGDTASIDASFASVAILSRTEGGDHGAFVGNFALQVVLAAQEAGDKGVISAIAAGIPPYFKVQESPDLGVLIGGSTGVWYLVYGNDGNGDPIDYDDPLTSTVLTTWTTSPLSPGTWKLGVRAANANAIELNRDAVVIITLDQFGNDISNIPLPPTGLRAFSSGVGGLKVEWVNLSNRGPKSPTGFNVYVGTPTPNYSQPAVPPVSAALAINNAYAVTVSGLIGGEPYQVVVRAFNNTGQESNTNAVTATPSGAGPLAVTGLSITAVV